MHRNSRPCRTTTSIAGKACGSTSIRTSGSRNRTEIGLAGLPLGIEFQTAADLVDRRWARRDPFPNHLGRIARDGAVSDLHLAGEIIDADRLGYAGVARDRVPVEA